jgi:hypothetical protein
MKVAKCMGPVVDYLTSVVRQTDARLPPLDFCRLALHLDLANMLEVCFAFWGGRGGGLWTC